MAVYSYDLLGVRSGGGNGRSWEPTGALVEQGLNLEAKYPLAARTAGFLARTRRSREVKLLTLSFDVDEQRRTVQFKATGPLSSLVRKRVAYLQSQFEKQGRPVGVREGGLVYNMYQPPVPSRRFVNALARLVVHGRYPIRPTTCTLQVTARCQLNCYHCSAARYKTPLREELSTEELQDAMRQAQDLGVTNIVLTGGEPLLRKDIFDLMAAADRDRAHVSIFTNGLLLTEETVARLKEAGVYSVMVSLDDPRPEEHERLRRIPGGFAKSTEGLKRAIDAGILTAISTYVSPQDLEEGRAEQMIEVAREVGVHEITIFDVIPSGKLLPLEEKQLLSPEDKRRIIELDRHYNGLEGYPHIITQALINGPEGSGCFAGHAQFYMTAYGDIDPCDFTPLTFGNVRDEPLADIWARMQTHPAYEQRCMSCRMQDRDFREKYIDPIPENVLLPWPALEELRERPHGPGAVAVNAEAEAPVLDALAVEALSAEPQVA